MSIIYHSVALESVCDLVGDLGPSFFQTEISLLSKKSLKKGPYTFMVEFYHLPDSKRVYMHFT